MTATGPLTGDRVFALKNVSSTGLDRTELWSAALGGGPPKLILGYEKARGGVPGALIDPEPSLRRAFSPDGKRIVVSSARQLVIVDLENGRARGLGVIGEFPAWSKRGDLIAYVHEEKPTGGDTTPIRATWVIRADGSGARKLAVAQAPLEWSSDDRLLARDSSGLVVIDVAGARIAERLGVQPFGTPESVSWRRGSSELAIITTVAGRSAVVIRDMSSGTARKVLEAAEGTGSIVFTDVRFRPSAEELLVTEWRLSGREVVQRRVHIVALPNDTDAVVAINAAAATWTPDGAGIAFIDGGAGAERNVAVQFFSRSSGATRELFGRSVGGTYLSLASVSYGP